MESSELFKEMTAETESRLDRFLRKRYPQLKLASIYKLIKKGWVQVNQKRVKDPAHRLCAGDRVFIVYVGDVNHMLRSDSRQLKPSKIPIRILYENENYIVVDKDSGISVHPGKRTSNPTLIEGLLYYGQKAGFKPHLVHRLDKHTSGVLVVCKNEESAKILSKLFKSREVEKEYITLVFGKTRRRDEINLPLKNQDALTIYQRLEYFPYVDVSLLLVKIKTGRKHQIRKHLSRMGHPVIMDGFYGNRSKNKWFRKTFGLKRYFLHCARIVFVDPRDNQRYEFESPLAKDLSDILKKLGGNR